jgi:hypothetical protein
MINVKYFLLPATVLALSIANAAIAKQPNTHGANHNNNSDFDQRLLNSNKQSKTGDNVRGRGRADERQEINQSRDHDNSGNANDRRGQEPPYNQYNDNINQNARGLPGGQSRHGR